MIYLIIIVQIFFIGATAGWVLELFFRRFAHKKWINPGFLVGPWLPLYGTGLLILFGLSLIDLSFIQNIIWQKVLLIFIITIVMTLLEYVTGLIFIKGLKVQLWDYSTQWGDIQGIICPLFTLIWGAIGAVYNLFLHPHILNLVQFLATHPVSYFVYGILLGMFILDNIYSFQVVAKIKKWAKQNDVVVKYEHLKLNIREQKERLKERYNFVFSLKGPGEIVFELNKYLLENGKKFFENRLNKKSKDIDTDKNDEPSKLENTKDDKKD